MPAAAPEPRALAADSSACAPPPVADRLDPESRIWVARLTVGHPEQEAATKELFGLLLNAARFVLVRRRGQVSDFPRETLDDLAVEAADDALIAILARLGEFRGESRFTTWAWKFAFFGAFEALRRRNWMGREIPSEDAGWASVAREVSPQSAVEQRELMAALRSGIEEALTPHQRAVFVALALNGVPVDVLAERMKTTRGALYKTLHEARYRLRAHLEASTEPSA